MLRSFISTILFIVYATQTIATTLGDSLKDCVEKENLSVLRGHQLLTGIRQLDDQTALQWGASQNLSFLDNVKMRQNETTAYNLILRQVKTELMALYGINCASDFYSPPEESDPIDLLSVKAEINGFIAKGVLGKDPTIFTLVIERALFASETPQTAMLQLIQSIEGITATPEDCKSAGDLLTLGMSGNTIAAQFAWQDKRTTDEWYLPYSKQRPMIQNAIKQLSKTRSKAFQYLEARSHFIDDRDILEKMNTLEALDTDASLDYYGVLYYANMIISSKPENEATFPTAQAINGWHFYFTNFMHRAISQRFAIAPLLKKNGKPLPRGYIEGLYAFAGADRSVPFHIMLRQLVLNKKNPELARCYIKKYLYDFPDTRNLSNAEKRDEIRAVGEVAPEAFDMLALVINNVIPAQSLGYSEESQEQRLEELEGLANDHKSITAQDILIDKYVEEFTRHLVTQNISEAQKSFGKVCHFAFKGNKKAQDTLVTPRSETEPTLLQLQLALNRLTSNTPAGAQQGKLNNEAHNLLRHVFRQINILKDPHTFINGPLSFYTKAEEFIADVESTNS